MSEEDPPVLGSAGRAVSIVTDSLKASPLAIALLIVNIGFLGFAAYLLGEVASNARERNASQTELITKLVTDIRDCRQGPRSSFDAPPIGG